ncbi:MAG: DUF86 domain-containing protein [Proteobacteria bacterium]|nr:DUF86 domain-containing protein [Pseudomonadota bacterium]
MAERSPAPRLADILEAIERVQQCLGHMTFEAFEADWEKQWVVERGIEIISEASRHLSEALKLRHPEIPWRKVAGVGNVLRHDYGNIAAPVIWGIAKDELPRLERVCREQLAAEQARENDPASS